MGLEITFDCRGYNGRIPDLRDGAHFTLTDGCFVDLTEHPEMLNEAQKQTLEAGKRDDRRNHKLCYLNIKFANDLFDIHGNFSIPCPTCRNEYILTRQEYQEAFEKFLRGEQD